MNGHTNGNHIGQTSDLSKIENPPDSPFELFKQWFEEAKSSHLVLPQALILSTATHDGTVSGRTLLLRRLEEDGFVIMTDNRSKKHAQISDNKKAAITFLWLYRTGEGERAVNRQVRIEGEMEILQPERFQDLYDREPLYCKIRAHLCHQDKAVDWEDAKSQHDEMYKECLQNGVNLPMPDHFIAYKMHPTMIEFYHAYTDEIGDRMYYSRSDNSKNIWKKKRLFA